MSKKKKKKKKTLAEDEKKHKCNSCTLHIVLFSIIFTIIVGINTYFVYYRYMNWDKKIVAKGPFYFLGNNY